jgi:hypothetical protein
MPGTSDSPLIERILGRLEKFAATRQQMISNVRLMKLNFVLRSSKA